MVAALATGRRRRMIPGEAEAARSTLTTTSGSSSAPAALVHVYEELAQHCGQMETTRDLLLEGER
jgi:hypothetical protein